jgi:tetratricopeptide (TPR) repeat protein
VPTDTPIPPTDTPEPTPTPINLVAVVEAFVLALNQGADVAEYLADDTAVIFTADAPIFVATITDFIAYSRQVESQFTLNECKLEGTAVACEAIESNLWLLVFYETMELSFEPSEYDKLHFAMTDEGRIAKLTLTLGPSSIGFLTDFWGAFEDWLLVNDQNSAEAFFTDTSQLVYNEKNGTQMPDLIQTFLDVMNNLIELNATAGDAYWAGDYETAVARYTDILDLKPDYDIQYHTLVKRADVYDEMGDYEAAIVDYETAVAIYNDDPNILNNLCWDYAITEQPELALPYCDKSIDLEPDPASMDSRGVAYGLLGDYEAAIADFEFVVADLENASDPELVAIRDQRADWIAQMKNGQNPFTSTVMAELRGEEPPPSPAADTSGDTDGTPTTAQDYFNMGESYAQQLQWQLAIDSYSQAIALAPQSPDYYSARGFAYVGINEIFKMLADFDQAIALGTQSGPVYFFRGLWFATFGDHEQAISHVERALALGLSPDLQGQAEALLNELK